MVDPTSRCKKSVIDFIRPSIRNLKEGIYADKIEKDVKISLDLSTVPLDPPKGISKRFHRYFAEKELSELKEEISRRFDVKTDNIMLTAGADQAINIVLTSLLRKNDTISIRIPTFPRFEIVAKALCEAKIKFFKDLKIPKSKVTVLCTPNNPTTEEISKKNLFKIVKNNQDKIIIIDAVFSELGTFDPSFLVKQFDNVIVLKSLSKTFGLAGLRVGFILANKDLIDNFRKCFSPFLVSLFSQKIALEVLRRNDIEKTRRFIQKEKKFLRRNLGNNFISKSDVPFFLLKVDKDSTRVKKELAKLGIGIVDGKDFKGLEINCLRIMVGKRNENKALVKAVFP